MKIITSVLFLTSATICTLFFFDSALFASSTPNKQISIAVSNTPLSSPIFIAKELGFFKNHQVDVELIRADGGVKCFNLLIDNKVDFATTSETVAMFNSFKRTDFSILVSFVESDNDLKLLSLDNNPYQEITQIANANVGIVKGSASEFFFDSMLMLNYAQNQNVNRVYLPPEQLVPALIAGQVDIISVWEPFGYQLFSQTSNAKQMVHSKGLHNLSFTLIGLKTSLIDEQTKISMLNAIADAIDYIQTHPEKSLALIGEILTMEQDQLSYLWADYQFKFSLSNALVSNMQSQAQWAIDRHLVPKDNQIDLRQIINKPLYDLAVERHILEH